MTVKSCNRPAVGGHRSEQMKLIGVYLFILMHILPVLFSEVVQKQTLGEVGTRAVIW